MRHEQNVRGVEPLVTATVKKNLFIFLKINKPQLKQKLFGRVCCGKLIRRVYGTTRRLADKQHDIMASQNLTINTFYFLDDSRSKTSTSEREQEPEADWDWSVTSAAPFITS